MNLLEYTKSFSSDKEKKGYLTKSSRNELREYIAKKRLLGWTDDKLYKAALRKFDKTLVKKALINAAIGGTAGYVAGNIGSHYIPRNQASRRRIGYAAIGALAGGGYGAAKGAAKKLKFKDAWKYVHNHPEYE